MRGPEGLLVETQALNGLRLWASHFSHVSVCAVELPPGRQQDSTTLWSDPASLLATGRLSLIPLPWGYHPRDHTHFSRAVRLQFRRLVSDHRYLCFSNLGAFGAWGSLAVAEARAQRRPYSLWFDWVLHDMSTSKTSGVMRRLKNGVVSALVKYQTFKAIRASTLGLFHGQTVYDAYSPLCRQSELVHDIHVHPEDAIGEEQFAAKVATVANRTPLKIGYLGRAHPMKAPLQWVDAVSEAIRVLGKGEIQATWLGDGPLLEDARRRVRELGLEDSIHFAGFVSDRGELLSFLRELDLFLFCHVTPESPRCLIESLICATPLVGYESAYARELVGNRGGAILTPVGQPEILAEKLIALVRDRGAIAKLTVEAGSSRAIFNDEAVFRHRSDLIKRYL